MIEEKIVLITGSSKGIGQAIAERFAKEKTKLIITYHHDRESADAAAKKCEELGASEVFVVQLDIKDSESIKKCFSEVEAKFGHIDYLVNNAGVIDWEKFENETFEEIEDQLRANLEGTIKMTSAFFPQIKEGVINIASRAGHNAYPGRAVYVASKFGVVGFTKSLAQEYPDLKIFTVSPGAVKTEMWDFEEGVEPQVIADYIIKALKGEVELKDGDLNLWEILAKK